MAPADRRCPAPPDPPIAERSRPPGGGARRSENRPLQRPLLRRRAPRGARARRADGPADVDHHGRPRSPQGHQQLVRPSRRRRRSQGDRRGLPQAAAALRRARTVRWGGVRHPPARDPAGASARDRRAHPAGSCRPALRGGDVERADPRHDLPRRRGLPEGRDRPERAHPPGRPRRLPRQAPGPEPRPGRELRAAAPVACRAPGQTRRSSRGRGIRLRRLPRDPGAARERAPRAAAPPAHPGAPALPRPLAARGRARRPRLGRRDRRRDRRSAPRHERQPHRADRDHHPGRRRTGALPRDGGRLDLGQCRRRARRRSALRAKSRASARRCDSCRGVELTARRLVLRLLQRRRAQPCLAGSGRRVQHRLERDPRRASS